MKSIIQIVFVSAAVIAVSGSQARGGTTNPAAPKAAREVTLRSFGQAGLGGDDTPVIQRAIAATSRSGQVLRIEVSKVPYRVGPLYLPSNSNLQLARGAVIQALPGYSDGQKLITIGDARNVRITGYGSTLKMNRSEYKGGEYRHCLYIIGSSNVVIKGVSCVDAGGAGIYVGSSDKRPYSEGVAIEDVRVEHSVGPGLNLVSGKHVRVQRSFFADSNGPEAPAGINVEPNRPSAILEDVRFESTATEKNAGDGIRFVFDRTNDTAAPVEIIVVGHHDKAAGASSFSGVDDPAGGRPVGGSIVFENCRSENAQQYGAVLSFWSSAGPRAVFRNLTVINPNESKSTMDNAAIAVKRGGGGTGTIGNVSFIRTIVKDTRPKPKLSYYFSFADYSNVGIRNVSFSNPVELSGALHQHPVGLVQGAGVNQLSYSTETKLSTASHSSTSTLSHQDGGNAKTKVGSAAKSLIQ